MSKKYTGTDGNDEEIEGRDYVVCQICGKRYRSITPKHLKQHNTTMVEYLKKFNDKLIKCSDIQIKRKETCLNRYGVENISQIDSVKDQKKKTYQDHFGIKHYYNQNEIKQNYIKDVDYVICEICGGIFEQITTSHLKIHKITLKEYKKIYPDLVTVSFSTEKKRIHSLTGREFSDEHKSNLVKNHRDTTGSNNPMYGKKHKTTSKILMGKNHRDMSGDNHPRGMLGKKHTEESLQLMRDSSPHLSGEDHPMFGTHHSKETREYLSLLNSGENNSMYGKVVPLEQKIKQSCTIRDMLREDFKGFAYEEINNEREIWLHNSGVEWRSTVFERDNYVCQLCGGGDYLNAHHILRFVDYSEFRSHIDNGITLCVDCHNKTKKHEKEYEAELLGIIFDNKGRKIFGGE